MAKTILKKPKTIQGWLTPKLRNIARMWPEKNKARDRAKVRIPIGHYKNGKVEYKVMYTCAGCGDNFNKEDTAADHIDPVVDPNTGFVDWNTYIERLFCESYGYQILCNFCHTSKSNCENTVRREVKGAKNNIK